MSGTLDYDEMVRLWLAFPGGYRCRRIIVGDTLLRTVLNMDEFQNPAAGFSFQASGDLVSPVGAKLLRWGSTAVLPADYVLGVDERFALEQVTEHESSPGWTGSSTGRSSPPPSPSGPAS